MNSNSKLEMVLRTAFFVQAEHHTALNLPCENADMSKQRICQTAIVPKNVFEVLEISVGFSPGPIFIGVDILRAHSR